MANDLLRLGSLPQDAFLAKVKKMLTCAIQGEYPVKPLFSEALSSCFMGRYFSTKLFLGSTTRKKRLFTLSATTSPISELSRATSFTLSSTNTEI